MARPHAREEDKVVETWQIETAGSVYVWSYDRRDDRYTTVAIGGRGSKRAHLSRDDRKYNQELIPVENRHLDPFTNGTLRLIDAATRDESLDMRYHLTDEDLRQLFEVREPSLFLEGISAIESELVLRRLADMADENGTVVQAEALKELIRERYPIGGTQTAVREMLEAGERLQATAMR